MTGTATFNGLVNIYTGNIQAWKIVSNQPHNEYNFRDMKGNVAAGSPTSARFITTTSTP